MAAVARASGIYRNYDLRRYVYQRIKDDHRLGAQAAQHVIKKVCDSYKSLKANIRAGNLGKPGSKRRRRAETNPITFRWEAAQPYDARMLSWQSDARIVSTWTVAGRLKNVAYTGSPDQLKAVAQLPVGECDLVHRDGRWFLYASVEVGEPATAASTATSGTGPTRKPSTVGRAGSLPTPITTRPSTSPNAVLKAGAQSTAHTRPDLAASEEETRKLGPSGPGS